MACQDTSEVDIKAKWSGRYWILVFDCLLVFGIAFVQDLPSALQSQLQEEQEDCNIVTETKNNYSCCSECFGLGPDRYNQLYSVFSWANAIVLLPAGIINDRLGNRISGILATAIAVIGSSLFAVSVSSSVRSTSSMFILMMAGRLFAGISTGSSRVVQDRVLAVWFKDKLPLAFGIVLSTVRLGYVLNFLLTSYISVKWGINAAVWLGVGLCFSCFISAIGLSILDRYGCKSLQLKEVKGPSSVTVVRDIRSFPCLFWLICAMLTSYYSFLTGYISNGRQVVRDIRSFPCLFWLICAMLTSYYSFLTGYISNGSKMLQDIYGFDKTGASIINGVLYDTSLLLCPVMGYINTRYGTTSVFSIATGVLSIPFLPLILHTGVSPILWNILLGILNSMAVSGLWSAISLAVPLKNVGTGIGIASLLLYASSGLTNLIIGKILGHFHLVGHQQEQWLCVFIVLIGHLIIMTACGVAYYVLYSKECTRTKTGQK